LEKNWRLTFVKILSISQIIGGFVKIIFFNENRLNKFSPPSWIIFQTQRLFVDSITKNKKHKSVLKSDENLPFGIGSKN
jgi:hypothetical protein